MSNQQSTVEFGLRAVQFSRLTRRGILLGLSLPQLIVLAIGVLSIVGALYAGGGILLAWTAPIWLLSAALAWTPVGGRKLIEWVPVLPMGRPHTGTSDRVPAQDRETPPCRHPRPPRRCGSAP